MNLLLADLLGTTWFIALSCCLSFLAGCCMADRIKNWIYGK